MALLLDLLGMLAFFALVCAGMVAFIYWWIPVHNWLFDRIWPESGVRERRLIAR